MSARIISLIFGFCTGGMLHAQIWLGGPGLEVGQYYIYEAPDFKTFDLGYYYTYEIHGYYGRTDADQVANTYVDSNGYMREIQSYTSGRNSRKHCSDSGGSIVYGWVHAALTLNSYRYPRKMNFQSNRVQDTTGDQVFSSSVYRSMDREVNLGFYFNGNTKDPDGYMVAFGAVVKEAPRPTGKLSAANYVLEGTYAEIGYEVNMANDDEDEYYEVYKWDPSNWTEGLAEPDTL